MVRGPVFGSRVRLTAASSSTVVRADRDSAWPKAGRAACSSASSGTRARSRATPRTSPSRSGTRRVGNGSCRAISARYRSCIAIRAAKKGVEPSSAGRMPFTMSSVVTIPRRASSAPARRVSAIAVASGWSTKANRVSDWSRSAASARSYLTFASAIADAKVKYERALAALRDQSLTRFAFVLHPEATAIAETRRAGAELARLGIVTTELIVNGILPAEEGSTPFFAARIAMQERYLAEIARQLPMPTRRVPLLDGEVRGVARLRALVPLLADEHAARPAFGHAESLSARTAVDDDAAVRKALLPDTGPRTIFFAGKGGVGKTVASCATAVWAARGGHRTLLVTTDPAAHIGQVLDAAVGTEPAPVDGVDGLWAARVDAKAAAIAYTDRIIADAVARGRSPEAVAAMREELDSPCTEEMAAFDQFIELASRDSFDVTLFDTAPTGHTMRLLELPIDWSRQIDVKVFASVDTSAADDVAKARFGGVIEMMRDPAKSTFAFVMYPESTPIVEAARAISELKTLGIPLGLVVANMVLPEEACRTPYARARRQMQQTYLADIEARFAVPILEIPLLDGEVVGLERLGELLERTLAPTALVA